MWAVRLFKTRTQSTEACRSGRVQVGGQAVKPGREVHPGDTIVVSFPPMVRTVRVIEAIHLRVGAALVPGVMEDLTPDEEFNKAKMLRATGFEYRERGAGRPTKLERRQIEYLKKYLGE